MRNGPFGATAAPPRNTPAGRLCGGKGTMLK